jgi:hypothetical protein
MNPPLPLALLLPLLAAVLAAAGWLSWRGSAGLPRRSRVRLLALRLAAFAGLGVLVLNPGRWIRPTETRPRPWLVLVDSSASMAQKAGDATRADVAAEYVGKLRAVAKRAELPVRVHPFAAGLEAPLPDNSPPPPPTGDGSRILAAASHALEEAGAAGDTPAGMLLLSDGRSTEPAAEGTVEAFAVRARAGLTPVFALAPGANETAPDLILTTGRHALTVFAGQPARLPWVLESRGFPAVRQDVVLTDDKGAKAAAQSADVPAGGSAAGVFEFPVPASGRWHLTTAVQSGEARPVNNRAAVHVRVLTARTRVFLAEGAPYWDSKFLAQLLRQQSHMEVQSVHRLSDQRYFRINSGDTEPAGTSEAVFPETAAELSRYDLVVFGKNTDSFLTNSRMDALRSFVRDHGGAVLFSRGRATSLDLQGLEPLEPVTWAAGVSGAFRFLPTPDGEAAGLFGQALPAPDAPQWKSLPVLQDGRRIAALKPFTRVLAEGSTEAAAGSGARFPALLVRRYGQGVSGLVNADGLWKWDFYPEARELGNMYEEFWTQLIQWMASYSEFLPGQDFSLRLPSPRAAAGATVPLQVAWRGALPAPDPRLVLTLPDGSQRELIPAPAPDAAGRPAWRTSFSPDRAGEWKIRLTDPRPNAPPAPEVICTVPAPPAESDDLSADAEYLSAIATAAGGSLIEPSEFDAFLRARLETPPPVTRETGAVWKPLWQSSLFALGLTALLAAEWTTRRRLGLA